MFDTRFVDSVAKVTKCQQITEMMPFRYVSHMYDSKMSSKMSIMKDSIIKDESQLPSHPKWLEEFTLLDLVEKFLSKDQAELPPKI